MMLMFKCLCVNVYWSVEKSKDALCALVNLCKRRLLCHSVSVLA